MTDTERMGPIQKMYDAGFGTGHGLDLRPIQVTLPEDDRVHNILRKITVMGSVVGALEPVPMTMCGIRLEDLKERPYRIIGEPVEGGLTTCDECAILAAWKVVATP